MVEVHEVVVDGVLRDVLRVASEYLLHVGGVAPAPDCSINARNVVQDEGLRIQKQNTTKTRSENFFFLVVLAGSWYHRRYYCFFNCQYYILVLLYCLIERITAAPGASVDVRNAAQLTVVRDYIYQRYICLNVFVCFVFVGGFHGSDKLW